MSDLFKADPAQRPLPARLRPTSIDDIVGQDQLLGPEGALTRMRESHRLPSLILWGPPGCGKTTLARLLADEFKLHFEPLSALSSGVAELRKIFTAAEDRFNEGGGTLLFLDEIHRYNRAQQEQFLPVVEEGIITLVGATTENPSFALVSALLSRAQVLVLRRLDGAALEKLIARAEALYGRPLPVTPQARALLLTLADGDGRYMLTLVEQIFSAKKELDETALMALVQRRAPLHDRDREGHYNLLSALHKTIRGSDVDAALYYFARLIEGGEDPRVIARRLTRAASEDVGMADPQCLPFCLAAWESFERLGTPEGELALAQAVIYLATAPKSNAAYAAFGAARRSARDNGSLMPPKRILNAPTKLMREEGYSEGYQYDHDMPDAFSGQNYWPDEMTRDTFYTPPDRGFEREITKRLAYWAKLRAERGGKK